MEFVRRSSSSIGNKDNDRKGREISKTWISGQSSCTLVIPKAIAEAKGLTSPSHVVVEDVPEGILIRKLNII